MAKLVTLVAALVGAAALTQTAAAVPPTTAHFTASGSVTIEGGALCSFPIVLDATQEFTTTTFYDEAGVITKRITSGTEHDTFSANGNTLVGDPYHFSFISDFENGVRIDRHGMGVAEFVHLPDGGLFVVAGRVDASSSAPILSVDSGNSGTNLEAFCAALT